MSRKSTDTTWARLKLLVRNRDKCVCQYCGRIDTKGEPDHVLPLKKGGTDSVDNLVWACRECNRSKGDKTIKEWVEFLIKKERKEILALLDEWASSPILKADYELSQENAYENMMRLIEALSMAGLIMSQAMLVAGIPKQMVEEFMYEKIRLMNGLVADLLSGLDTEAYNLGLSPLELLYRRTVEHRLNGYPYLENLTKSELILTEGGFQAFSSEQLRQLRMF